MHVRAGQTLRSMLLEAAGGSELSPDLRVRVGGYDVPASHWDRVRPKKDTCITVVRDGLAGGGDGWKQVLGAVIMIVVAIYAPGWGNALVGSTYGAAFGAAITLATPLLSPALIGEAP